MLGRAIAISIAAQAAVLPIVVWYFQRLTPAAVLGGIVAMPLAAGSLVTAALLLIVAPVAWIGEAFAWLVWLQVKGLTLCGQVAVALPGGSMRVARAGLVVVLGLFHHLRRALRDPWLATAAMRDAPMHHGFDLDDRRPGFPVIHASIDGPRCGSRRCTFAGASRWVNGSSSTAGDHSILPST